MIEMTGLVLLHGYDLLAIPPVILVGVRSRRLKTVVVQLVSAVQFERLLGHPRLLVICLQ